MIRNPRELQGYRFEQLELLCEDLRQKIISTCLKNGGHLGASLGAVELAVALHRQFDSPREPIIWDVGHQAYAHKLLTGRWEKFESLRTWGGISGFLARDESEHDVFGAGHAATALSAALAMAWARRQTGLWTVAVIGDGSLTSGGSFEAMNNLKEMPTGPMLIVLNDNSMSISPNVGAISTILSEGRARDYFDLMGCDYAGPIDGHDLSGLLAAIGELRSRAASRPVVLHVLTQKGRGYPPAEDSPASFHGISPVRHNAGATSAPGGRTQTYSDFFGQSLCALAERDPRVVAITAAMKEGTGLSEFARRFPDRFFDVGIAEQHAATFAAGLATQGLRPVVAIYSTFLQRALDALIHDVALQRLNVIFAIDRAGVVGADGATHHGAFDLAYLGMIPGISIAAPVTREDLAAVLDFAISGEGPVAIRYPRGGGPEAPMGAPDREGLRWLSPEVPQPKLIAVALGASGGRLAKAMQQLSAEERGGIAAAAVIWAQPLNEGLVRYIRRNPGAALLTMEDGAVRGGFGQAILGVAGSRSGRVALLGYPDRFIQHGSPAELEAHLGMDPHSLLLKIRELLH